MTETQCSEMINGIGEAISTNRGNLLHKQNHLYLNIFCLVVLYLRKSEKKKKMGCKARLMQFLPGIIKETHSYMRKYFLPVAFLCFVLSILFINSFHFSQYKNKANNLLFLSQFHTCTFPHRFIRTCTHFHFVQAHSCELNVTLYTIATFHISAFCTNFFQLPCIHSKDSFFSPLS